MKRERIVLTMPADRYTGQDAGRMFRRLCRRYPQAVVIVRLRHLDRVKVETMRRLNENSADA